MVTIPAGQIVVELKAQTANYLRELKAAEAQFVATVRRVQHTGTALSKQPLGRLGSSTSAIGAARKEIKGLNADIIELQAGLPLGPAIAAFSRFVLRSFRRIDPKAAARTFADGFLDAVASEVGEAGVEAVFGSGEAIDAGELFANNVDELTSSVDKYEQATKDAQASADELRKRYGSLADEIREEKLAQSSFAGEQAQEDQLGTARQFSQRFGSFEPIDLEVFRNINARQKELQAQFFKLTLSEGERTRIGAEAANLRDISNVVDKLQTQFDLTREKASDLFEDLNTLEAAKGAKQTARAFFQVAEGFDRVKASSEKTKQELDGIVQNSFAVADASARLQGIIETLPEELGASTGQASGLADQLLRAASNASKLSASGQSRLQEAQLGLRFAGDPVGLAGEVAKKQFENETKLFRQRLELQQQLIKKRDQVVALAKEEARTILMAIDAERKARSRIVATSPSTNAPPDAGNADTMPSAHPQSAQDIQRQSDSLNAQADAFAKVNPLIDDYGSQLAKARAEQDLLTAAQQSGLEVAPELRAQIEQLATAYATAQAGANQLAASQESLREFAAEFNNIAKNALGGFIDDLRNGTSAADALENALRRIEDRLVDIALNALFSSSGGGLFGSILGGVTSGLFGFRNGGQVKGFAAGGLVAGPGSGRSDSIPALLSNGEFVANARATRDNRPLLEAINAGAFNLKGLAGFADGGLVAEDFVARRIGNLNPVIRRPASATPAPVVVPPPQVNQRIINAFDENEVVSNVLDGPVGESSVLNMVRRSPSKFRGALGL